MFGKQQWKMSQYGHYTMTCGRYIKRGKMSGKCLFLQLKGSKPHAKYYFLTPGGPIYVPIKYRNFAQSPFNGPAIKRRTLRLPLTEITGTLLKKALLLWLCKGIDIFPLEPFFFLSKSAISCFTCFRTKNIYTCKKNCINLLGGGGRSMVRVQVFFWRAS